MATKSAEGETTERETTEFIDLSTEILAPADSTANEDEEEEEEEEEVDSCESDQEWDVDSFKDEDFHSSDLSDDEDLRRYVRQCYKSEGFDVPLEYLPRRSTRIYSGFNPVDLGDFFKAPYSTGREYMETVLKVKKNLVLDHIVRAVVKMGVGVKSYITFMARESPDGELVEYQGKAEWKVWQRNIHPLLCRPASEQKINCANL
ncbi:unnamed protein product [Microthlaspi erraticum]|uniref:Uncharacterized protein n=1 Tax=Microthlaspi erraticum TaxID=1685480 RepID=A0A6D2J6G1_9BRAS|nr:unnamed protein product [Microthlaspi erraticum]